MVEGAVWVALARGALPLQLVSVVDSCNAAPVKRDMDLVRMLLIHTETGEHSEALAKYDEATKAGHIAIMKEAGLVEAVIRNGPRGVPSNAAILRLTWDGHDFLDAARDDTIWKKAQEKVLKPTASWTFGILTEWLKAEARQRLFGGDTAALL